MSGALAALLPEGRLHLQHGPIDIVAQAFGEAAAVRAAHARAAGRFASILAELVAELPALRRVDLPLTGSIARRMAAAVAPFRPAFITPMAAVAGAVAEEIVAALAGPGVTRAYANNGGDIALWLAPGQELVCALAVTGGLDRVRVRAEGPVRGIATSGWRGRSLSLGIADAVTVVARTAALADAAATTVANAVDLPEHPGIVRRRACEVQADSDLGDRLVTVSVPVLSAQDRDQALTAGLRAARGLAARGLIEGAALFLQGECRMTGALALAEGEKLGV
ncbi:UPF0280 family protein [Rhodobacter sp. Har01]|uniref:UPF0280 family protein n=1 Tax=Rhodobacter sp. Har01 TaxID=2883999 RepID=UPI001D07B62B|nr:UPF0280 family protein [Rhodobacter sp. Har01]MCB6177086.1 UPF0280 family protein [Rhodobacter sp. Har01]